MKPLFLTLLLTATLCLTLQAQEGAKLAKQAAKALTTYNMDPANNTAKLTEAKTLIDQALQQPDAQALYSAWFSKGEIYSTIFQLETAQMQFNPQAKYSGDNDALAAYDAYKKAYEIGTKKFEKADAAKGVTSVQGGLINLGIAKYDKGEYEKALASFEAVLTSHDLLTEAKLNSLLSDPVQYDNQVFTAAITATLAKNCEKAMVYYNQLYTKGTDKAAVYDGMYTCLNDMGKQAEARKILTEGRQKFPEDTGLLFSEINVYLREGRLDELTSNLKKAIEAEPNNIGLYITLGNVYDNLYSRELKANNTAKADEYFNLAKQYYTEAINRDPKNADAQYSMGTLYYNKAALRSEELNKLADDYSAAGIKKYEQIKKEMMSQFELALPYFQKAEALNPNEKNTLLALSEIYARKDDPLAAEFKKRLDVLNSGKQNETSYFKQ